MKHTIISWDCSYRNFFHIVDALAGQVYDKSEYELIYVEQRSRQFADEYNYKLGLKSLSDRLREVGDRMNFEVAYLNLDVAQPYHLGLCVNRGLESAKGEIISVMDGDMLLPNNFLTVLDDFHRERQSVANIVRRMVPEPVGASFDNWTKGEVDYKRCLEKCPNAYDPLPAKVPNKGPMISAPESAWEAINGYDDHRIWSTGLSRLGQDVNARLEIYLQCDSRTLPDCVAVHPYHPVGFSRSTYRSVRLLSLQDNIIAWTRKYGVYDWKSRKHVTDAVYEKNKKFVDSTLEGNTEFSARKISKLVSDLDPVLANFYRKIRKYIKLVPVEWRI